MRRNRGAIGAQGPPGTLKAIPAREGWETGGNGGSPARSPGTATGARFAVIGSRTPAEPGHFLAAATRLARRRPLRPLTRDGGPLAQTGEGASGARAGRAAGRGERRPVRGDGGGRSRSWREAGGPGGPGGK